MSQFACPADFWLGPGRKFLKRPVYHDALADLPDRFVASEPVPTA